MSSNGHFVSFGGGIHHTAIIGSPPESEGWTPESLTLEPVIEEGARIEAYVTIDAGTVESTRVGARTWLMKHVHLGHDAQIGPDVQMAPGVVIGGHAVIGDHVRIGINACVLPYRHVGSGAHVGAGAVVTQNVEPGDTVAGNPARHLVKSSDVPFSER